MPDEFFDVVDENGNVIGVASRDECHEKGHWHRASHIILVNSDGKILLQKRSAALQQYAGFWTSSASGHVDAGEDYESAAHRELMEEIGAKASLSHVLDIRKFTGSDNELVRLFVGTHDGPFSPNDEVEKVEFFTIEEIRNMLENEKFTPGSTIILKKIVAEPSILDGI